ncbi:hypothetical protein [Kordiimonas aquimaris]|uniref:hypothetical protein n=1 Tax=Kordiimonas aquimaris TaxID=707591 RepID=UPI0021CECAAD|nr:hypothetical protein [Kordiimonas aquimaris]
MKLWIVIFLYAASSHVNASEDSAAHALNIGDFERARALGRAAETAHGFTVACRAGMLIGGYQESGSAAVRSLHDAISDCRHAVTLDPQNIDARITLAIGVGFEGKRFKKPSLAKKSRKLLEQIYKDFPNQPAAHAAIGGWHSEVSAAGFLARVYLGASRSKAKQYFAEAVMMGETGLPFMLEYLKLLARGGTKDRQQGAALVEQHMRKPAITAINRLIQDKTKPIIKALKSKDKKAIKKAIAAATAFNGIEAWRDIAPLNLDSIEP